MKKKPANTCRVVAGDVIAKNNSRSVKKRVYECEHDTVLPEEGVERGGKGAECPPSSRRAGVKIYPECKSVNEHARALLPKKW